jgi:hypothetical protein
MDFVILMVVAPLGLLYDSIVCFVNVLGAVARLARVNLVLEFTSTTHEPVKMLERFLFYAVMSVNLVPLLCLLFRRYFYPPAPDRQEEEEEEQQEQEEQQEEEDEPCDVCGSTFCSECQLFRRIDWTSFTSGERIIELEVPIRDEGRLRQFILEQDPDVDIRIRHRSYYTGGACADETRVVLTKYPATKSALKN